MREHSTKLIFVAACVIGIGAAAPTPSPKGQTHMGSSMEVLRLPQHQTACIVDVIQNNTDPETHIVSRDVEVLLTQCFAPPVPRCPEENPNCMMMGNDNSQQKIQDTTEEAARSEDEPGNPQADSMSSTPATSGSSEILPATPEPSGRSDRAPNHHSFRSSHHPHAPTTPAAAESSTAGAAGETSATGTDGDSTTPATSEDETTFATAGGETTPGATEETKKSATPEQKKTSDPVPSRSDEGLIEKASRFAEEPPSATSEQPTTEASATSPKTGARSDEASTDGPTDVSRSDEVTTEGLKCASRADLEPNETPKCASHADVATTAAPESGAHGEGAAPESGRAVDESSMSGTSAQATTPEATTAA